MKAEVEHRTNRQNRSLHLYLEWLAEALDREGHTLQDVVAQIKKAEIRPTKENMKEVVWKPMQQALYNKGSTTELTTGEVDRVYEAINHFISNRFEIHVPFPNEEDLRRLQAGETP